MDSYIPYFKDTTRKNGNYKLLQCKACIWLISNPSLHEITLTKDFKDQTERGVEKRCERLKNHFRKCPAASYRDQVPGIPDNSTLSITPSESFSCSLESSVPKKRLKVDSKITPGFYTDAPVDQDWLNQVIGLKTR